MSSEILLSSPPVSFDTVNDKKGEVPSHVTSASPSTEEESVPKDSYSSLVSSFPSLHSLQTWYARQQEQWKEMVFFPGMRRWEATIVFMWMALVWFFLSKHVPGARRLFHMSVFVVLDLLLLLFFLFVTLIIVYRHHPRVQRLSQFFWPYLKGSVERERDEEDDILDDVNVVHAEHRTREEEENHYDSEDDEYDEYE